MLKARCSVVLIHYQKSEVSEKHSAHYTLHLNSIHLQVHCTVLLINGPGPCVWTVVLHACYHCYMPVCGGSFGSLNWQENSHKNINNASTCMPLYFYLSSSVLTALDVNSASGVVSSQQVLHHTCVIPRILQFCFVDLDSGVLTVGDNTCTAESGESGQGGNSIETQQVETWGIERQTTGQQQHGNNSLIW